MSLKPLIVKFDENTEVHLEGEKGYGLVLECQNPKTMEICHVSVSKDTHEAYEVPTQLVKPKSMDDDPKLGRVVFVPFWGFDVEIIVKDRKIKGGGVWRLLTGQKLLSGNCTMYVCAADFSDDMVDELSLYYSLHNPSSNSNLENYYRNDFDKLPVIMDKETAYAHSEFIFLKNEFEASGTLQWIDYNYYFKEYGLVYLPFYMSRKKAGVYTKIIH